MPNTVIFELPLVRATHGILVAATDKPLAQNELRIDHPASARLSYAILIR